MAHIRIEGADLSFPLVGVRPAGGMLPHSRLGSRITKARGGASVSALRAIDLEVTEGERIGLVGPNGAGKSSLLRLIAGIYPPDRGSVVRTGRAVPLLSLGMGI